ncbi:uncharacterized protein LOC120075707 isoform X1 [Benincasa hispida]|uniref:uncharacterized protein LOC120075707 isoform X1 n=1 Tax=Benincasa hispida TaxID=102211 RepID=UPI001900C38A|nr:uncharacterized protein LOC120075707 isoform X1 [Benincasa hispida]
MAACCSWKTLRISSSSARTLLHRSSSSPSASHFVSKPTMSAGLPSAKPPASSRFYVQKLTNFSQFMGFYAFLYLLKTIIVTTHCFYAKCRCFFRLPVELSSVQSLMPLHSVTASALFTSLLSLHNNSWGYLSEGFATPL